MNKAHYEVKSKMARSSNANLHNVSLTDFERLFSDEHPTHLQNSFQSLSTSSDEAEVDSLLELGRYSSVFIGRFRGIKSVIKKFLTEHEEEDPRCTGKDAFIKEYHMASGLNHPHIVPLLGQNPYSFSLIYEYMNLGALDYYLFESANVLDKKTSIRIAIQVGEALQYLHQVMKIVHLDVKSSNVLLQKPSNRNTVVIRAKLCDLGFAQRWKRDVSPIERLHTLSGTPEWMAPELLLYKLAKFISPPSDVYSFGILLWQVFTRLPPFGEIDLKTVVNLKKWNHVPRLSAKVPTELTDILQSCWEYDPIKRPDMGLLVQKLVILSYDF